MLASTTVTSTVPADPSGLMAVHVVAEVQLTDVPGDAPKLMVSVGENPVPVIVTVVPPDVGPELGSTAVTVGVAGVGAT